MVFLLKGNCILWHEFLEHLCLSHGIVSITTIDYSDQPHMTTLSGRYHRDVAAQQTAVLHQFKSHLRKFIRRVLSRTKTPVHIGSFVIIRWYQRQVSLEGSNIILPWSSMVHPLHGLLFKVTLSYMASLGQEIILPDDSFTERVTATEILHFSKSHNPRNKQVVVDSGNNDE